MVGTRVVVVRVEAGVYSVMDGAIGGRGGGNRLLVGLAIFFFWQLVVVTGKANCEAQTHLPVY